MKRLSLADAISHIEPHHRVLVSPGCGHPSALCQELGRQAGRFSPLTIMGGITLSEAPYLQERYRENFQFVTYHAGGPARGAIERGQARYVPLRYFDTLAAFSPGGPLAADVLLCQVAPPDRRGRYCLGPSVSYPLPIARRAPLVIAQENPQVPRTLGNAFLSEDEIDVLVGHEEPLVEYASAAAGGREQRIARQIAALVPDGATVQVGIGAVPEALLGFLTDKRRLRLHSLLVDSALALFEKGAALGGPEGSRICEIMGTRALFDFAHENPDVYMDDSRTVHDPRAIARIAGFVSIVSALEVDLSGQVAAESVGSRLVAGVGGQLDFAMGSALSGNALCIVALPSTGGKGAQRSRIVPALSPGSAVTTPRSLVRFVVTEHGLADLWGLDLKGRARALTRIAAPEFREELERGWGGLQ